MWIQCILLCLCVGLSVSADGQSDVRKPPSIKTGPTSELTFKPISEIALTCKAEGNPEVQYFWKKDGTDLNLNSERILRRSDGDIEILKAQYSDNGFYQCFAENQYGTALSNVAHVQSVFIHVTTTPISGVDPMTVTEGLPFVILAARRVDSFPPPIYSWEIAATRDDSSPKLLLESKRIHMAFNGDLYVAHALKEDERSGYVYKNAVFNRQTDTKQGGSYTTLTVTRGPESTSNYPPNITYFSKSQEIALVGGSISLKCFSSGKPLPDISWSWPGDNLPSGRFVTSSLGTELNISNIIESDEGDYECTAKNAEGTFSNTLHVDVQAVPVFMMVSDGPHDVNVTEGDSVTFNCSAAAEPEADIAWFRNGKPLDVRNGPKRFVFGDDGRSLTIRDVCRDCTDRKSEGRTDLTVIQCNASNVHGYAFASGYLNVLLRTKVISLPSSTVVSVVVTEENRFEFDCIATSDPSTPPTVQWYMVSDADQESMKTEAPNRYVLDGNLTILTSPNCSTCDKYLGEYWCVGSNGYSTAIAKVILNSTAEFGALTLEEGSLMWIVVVIAIILFLFLLLLICCIVRQFTKRDTYDVDQRERKSGRNPVEEIRENDFQDYYPCSDNGKRQKGSCASLGSADMYREYDDEVNFREDGSFVGKYRDGTLRS